MPHPFRFAVQLHGPAEGRTWADTCREMEGLGYSTIFVPDHFDEGIGPITAMATAAAATTTTKVGALVLDTDFRHPAVVARELASIDMLSEGRLIVGLGAGWKRTDYDHSGIPMDRPGVRVSRMIEHARVLRALFTEESATFHGEHFTITDLPGMPRPHRSEGPPFLIGGGGPRLLRFAGSFADIVGVNPSIHSGAVDTDAARDAMPDRIDAKFDWVAEGVADRTDGRHYADLEFNSWLAAAAITDDREGMADVLAALFDVTPEEGLETPMALVGNVEQCCESLVHRRDRWGYSFPVIPGDHARDFAPVVAALTGT